MKPQRHFKLDLNGVFCFVFAVGVLVLGTVETLDIYWLKQRGEVVTATVVEVHHGRKSSSIDVRYQTKAGETIEDNTSNFNTAPTGQHIPVIYDRENPHRMQAADWGLNYWPEAIWFAMGLGFACGGAVQLFPKRVSKYAKPASS